MSPSQAAGVPQSTEQKRTLSPSKIPAFLKQKSDARHILPSKSAYNEEVRSRAASGDETEIGVQQTRSLIPFDEAWEEGLTFIGQLEVPD
jgi:hypothetical protein